MKHAIVFILRAYRTLLSPLLPFNNCRFYPSCSQYAIEAVEKHGITKGITFATARILSCHPFSKKHGYDPVP